MLQHRLPTLKLVSSHMWRHTVALMHALPAEDLAAWLRSASCVVGCMHGDAGTAAAFLGNLLEGAPVALTADGGRVAALRPLALQFVNLELALLAVLPWQVFFGSPGGQPAGATERWTEDGEEEGQAALVLPVAQAHKLSWDAEQLPSSAVVLQLQLVTDSLVTRQLVSCILSDDGQLAASEQLQQRARDVRQLCSLLQQVLLLPGHRKRLLVTLAFSAGLVQRMWFGYLSKAQAAPGEICKHTLCQLVM
jgi:hypothetical protein